MRYLFFSVIYILSQTLVFSQKIYPVIGYDDNKAKTDTIVQHNIENVQDYKLLDSLIMLSLSNSLYLCYNETDLAPSGLRRTKKNEVSKIILGVGVKNEILYLPNNQITQSFTSPKNKNSLKINFERYSDQTVFSSNKHSVHSDSLYSSSVPLIDSKIQFDNSESDGIHVFVRLDNLDNFKLKVQVENLSHKNLNSSKNLKNSHVFLCQVSEGMLFFKYKGQYNSNGRFLGLFNLKNEKGKKKEKVANKSKRNKDK